MMAAPLHMVLVLLLACCALIVVLKLVKELTQRKLLTGVFGVVVVLALVAVVGLFAVRSSRFPHVRALGPIPPVQVPAPALSLPHFSSVSVEIRNKTTSLKSILKDQTREVRLKARSLRHGDVLGTVLTALAIAAFLYMGYVFLDASTRGHFTWSLRLLSIVVFAAVCVTMAALRHRL